MGEGSGNSGSLLDQSSNQPWDSAKGVGLMGDSVGHYFSRAVSPPAQIKASILQRSAFFTVQLSHPYMTTGKTIALTRQTFVDQVMSLLLNMLSRLVITFLPRSKRLLISWLNHHLQ